MYGTGLWTTTKSQEMGPGVNDEEADVDVWSKRRSCEMNL